MSDLEDGLSDFGHDLSDLEDDLSDFPEEAKTFRFVMKAACHSPFIN